MNMHWKGKRIGRKFLGALLCLAQICLLSPAASAAENQPEGVCLLVGYDQQEGTGAARSDTMILCRFDKETEQLVLVSLLRDLYVSVPGHGKNRLNAAYALGGMPLLKDTIQQNFRVDVDGCVEVDFSRFSQIIDILGGVELELREDEARLIARETGTTLEPGKQTLTGSQALAYARIRCLDADGDFSRTRRQRSVLEALWDAYKGCSFPKLVRVMGSLLPMVRTDLESGVLLRTALDVSPHLSGMKLEGYSIPAKEQCRDQVIDGMAVLTADMEKTRVQLHSYLFPENTTK